MIFLSRAAIRRATPSQLYQFGLEAAAVRGVVDLCPQTAAPRGAVAGLFLLGYGDALYR